MEGAKRGACEIRGRQSIYGMKTTRPSQLTGFARAPGWVMGAHPLPKTSNFDLHTPSNLTRHYFCLRRRHTDAQNSIRPTGTVFLFSKQTEEAERCIPKSFWCFSGEVIYRKTRGSTWLSKTDKSSQKSEVTFALQFKRVWFSHFQAKKLRHGNSVSEFSCFYPPLGAWWNINQSKQEEWWVMPISLLRHLCTSLASRSKQMSWDKITKQ